MSCPAKSSNLTLMPCCQNQSKANIQDQFVDNLKSYNGSNLQNWELVISTMPNFTEQISLQ